MSLLESCIGVAIISGVAMAAVPSLIEAGESYLLSGTAHHVAASLRSTRIKAITRNRDCRFRVTTSVSFVIECLESVWLPEEYGTVPRGFTITANAAPRFHRRGNVSPAATISLWNVRGRSRRVIVNISGRVRIE